jgi:DNA-binding MarR family transcriptional regulator
VEDNPHHKRAALVVITASGRTAFETVTARQVPWVNALARGVATNEIAAATVVLRRLEARLNALDDEGVAPASARRSRRT